MDSAWWDGDAVGNGPGLLAALWRYRVVIAMVTVLAAIAGYGASKLMPVRYDADAALILQDPGSSVVLGTSGGGSSDLATYLAKQANIMSSREVLQRAVQLAGGGQTLPEVRREVTVEPSKDLASIHIRATAGDADSAAALATAVGAAYKQVTAQRAAQEAQRAILSIARIRQGLQAQFNASVAASPNTTGRPDPRQDALASQIALLQQREQEISTQAAVFGSGVELFETADKPEAPSAPKPKILTVLGALLGLIGAGAWAWWAAPRNLRAQKREDPASILEAPLLGEVPEYHAPPLRAGTPIPSPAMLGPVVAEAYHFIVASLEHALSGVGGSTIVVTSAAPGDGKTSTVLNIAIAAQQEQRQIVIVDADERTRRLTELCGENGEEPRATYVGNGPVDLKEHLHCLDLADRGIVLPVLPSGTEPEHPAGFFRTSAFRKALLSIGEQADLVLIDAPALLAVADTIAIANQADGVVLVVKRGIRLSDLRNVRDRLTFTGTPLLGYVFNRSGNSLEPYPRTYSRNGKAGTNHRNAARLGGLLKLGKGQN
jgi:Mrp family chromosome partitioning ATPase